MSSMTSQVQFENAELGVSWLFPPVGGCFSSMDVRVWGQTTWRTDCKPCEGNAPQAASSTRLRPADTGTNGPAACAECKHAAIHLAALQQSATKSIFISCTYMYMFIQTENTGVCVV